MTQSTALTPKQREIRDREWRILQVATPMIRHGGLAAIQMGTIAKEMHLTRGTLYNHFANREEIVLSLAAQAVRRRVALLQFAVDLHGHSRDRVAAVGLACEAYVDLMPDDFAVEQMVRHDSIWQKTSDARQNQLRDDEKHCMQLVGQTVASAVEKNDLTLGQFQTAEGVLFGLWSLIYGGLTIEATSPSLADAGIESPRQAIRSNFNALLDGIGWYPLHDPLRYESFANEAMTSIREQAKQILASGGEVS